MRSVSVGSTSRFFTRRWPRMRMATGDTLSMITSTRRPCRRKFASKYHTQVDCHVSLTFDHHKENKASPVLTWITSHPGHTHSANRNIPTSASWHCTRQRSAPIRTPFSSRRVVSVTSSRRSDQGVVEMFPSVEQKHCRAI